MKAQTVQCKVKCQREVPGSQKWQEAGSRLGAVGAPFPRDNRVGFTPCARATNVAMLDAWFRAS